MTKTVKEARRAAFKKWFDSLPWVMCEKCSGDEEIAWRGFNAGLDAVEIELKAPHNDYSYSDSEVAGACKYYEQARAAIEQTGLGLKVKP